MAMLVSEQRRGATGAVVFLACLASWVLGLMCGAGVAYEQVAKVDLEIVELRTRLELSEERRERVEQRCASFDGTHGRLDDLEAALVMVGQATVGMHEECVVPAHWHDVGIAAVSARKGVPR